MAAVSPRKTAGVYARKKQAHSIGSYVEKSERILLLSLSIMAGKNKDVVSRNKEKVYSTSLRLNVK